MALPKFFALLRTGRAPSGLRRGASHGATIPRDFRCPPQPPDEDTEAWKKLSELLARGASGTVRVLLGNPRPDSIWAKVELPELKDNTGVTKIIKVDPETGAESVLLSR